MSIDTSKILDDFNPNQRSDKGRGGGNPLFKKNSDRDSFGGNDRGRGATGRYGGPIQRGGGGGGERFSNDRGGRQYINNNDRFRNDSGGFNPGREQNNYNPNPRRNFFDNNSNFGGRDFHNREGGHGYGGRERDFRGRGDGFGGRGRDFRGRRDGFGGRGRDFGGRGDGFGGRGRDFGGRGDGFGGRGRGPRFPRDYDDSGRDYEEMKQNFGRNDDEYNEEYQMKKEAQFEKEKYLMDFKKKYKDIIEDLKVLFVNENLNEEEIYQIIKNIISNPCLTIFEAMNLIYREVQIIKTIQFVNSEQKREYGPNKDILEQYEKFYPNNLKEIIQKYKIYKIGTENYNVFVPEKYWLYIDDSDKRRKLIKDELGYFNYLPILNSNNNKNNNEDDVYAKNEIELLYHFLYYKTLLCKQCDLSNENKKENIFCPYAHDILKDFRIIYDYKNEEISKFMMKLLNNKFFNFENYLKYIPMSLSPEFNLDTFKVHKCQLDPNCPNDYHLCPYYHSKQKGDEQRRPPLLFGYSGNTGDICFDEKKKGYCPKKCKCGIFCQYLHSRNEYNYYPDHFRKVYKCQREKIKGKCIYYKTCYGIHNYSSDEDEEEEEEDEEDKITPEEIENDENIDKIKDKVNNSFSIGKNFRCRNCQNVSENGELCYLMECNHFICFKCFKKICSENNKKKKKNKEKLSLLCPFCKNVLEKGKIFKISFKMKVKE